jgi:hypothetical protein
MDLRLGINVCLLRPVHRLVESDYTICTSDAIRVLL